MEILFIIVVGLFIFYIVIEAAVRRGINSSVLGRFIEEKNGFKEERKSSFLDKVLDNDLNEDK